jgi:hypothetical protein
VESERSDRKRSHLAFAEQLNLSVRSPLPLINQNNKMRKYIYLYSYSGLVLTPAYIFLTISVAHYEQQQHGSNCIAYCGEGLGTSILILPGWILSSLFTKVDYFSFHNWNQINTYMSLTALLLYIALTALEKFSCYLIHRFRRKN